MKKTFIISIVLLNLVVCQFANIARNEFYDDEMYFCHNPDYADRSTFLNIHKSLCEPYNENYLEGKPSIVRFPVSFFHSMPNWQFYVQILCFNNMSMT